jgi:hypothetical protein
MSPRKVFSLIKFLYLQALSRVSWLKPPRWLSPGGQDLLTTLVFTGSESGLVVQTFGWLSPRSVHLLCSCMYCTGSESGLLVQTFGWFSPGTIHYSCIPRLWVGSFDLNFWMAQPRICSLIMLLYFQALSRVSWFKPSDGSAQDLLTTPVFPGSESGGLLVQTFGWLSPGSFYLLCSCISRLWVGCHGWNLWMAQPRAYSLLLYLQALSQVSWFNPLDGSAQGLLNDYVLVYYRLQVGCHGSKPLACYSPDSAHQCQSCIYRLWVGSPCSNPQMSQHRVFSLIKFLYLQALSIGSHSSKSQTAQPRTYSLYTLVFTGSESGVFWFKLLDGWAHDLFTYCALVFPGSESSVLVQTFGWFSPRSAGLLQQAPSPHAPGPQ